MHYVLKFPYITKKLKRYVKEVTSDEKEVELLMSRMHFQISSTGDQKAVYVKRDQPHNFNRGQPHRFGTLLG